MKCSIVLLALLASACAQHSLDAADQLLLKKQQDIIHLLQDINNDVIPNDQLNNHANTYDIQGNAQQYENPIVVKYYAGAVQAGLVQPKNTVYSSSISQLRKETSLLHKILVGARDYQVFLMTAAWARVHVHPQQFTKAFIAAVLERQDTQGIILPPIYEIWPNYYLDARVIQEAQDTVSQIKSHGVGQGLNQIVVIPANHSALLPHGEQKVAHFTQDIGIAHWLQHVKLGQFISEQHETEGMMGPQQKQQQQQQTGEQTGINRGELYQYLHQQLLARYQLERLGQNLELVENVDLETMNVPYKPHLRYQNGLELPGRPEGQQQSMRTHQQRQLMKIVQKLESRLIEAIDSGHVITSHGAFLSLYQPQGLTILVDLIQGSGKSVNPRYYGHFVEAAKQLLGNVPKTHNINEHTPAALELSPTMVKDPAFWHLLKKVINLFQQYQESLPAYQYNDLVLPGVKIENVQVSDLVTHFNDYYVDLSNAVVGHTQQTQQTLKTQQTQQGGKTGSTGGQVIAQLKRLDHKPYEFQITVESERHIPGAVIRVFLGPKHDQDGNTVSINHQRQNFVELDQFIQDLQPGTNTIVRHSHQAPQYSHDHPSVEQIIERVQGAIRSQEPLYITQPQQIFGWPARLALPKGRLGGFPLQLLVVVSGPGAENVGYGPVIPEQWQTYQPQTYKVVDVEDYVQNQNRVSIKEGVKPIVEVAPEFIQQQGSGIGHGQGKGQVQGQGTTQMRHHGQWSHQQHHSSQTGYHGQTWGEQTQLGGQGGQGHLMGQQSWQTQQRLGVQEGIKQQQQQQQQQQGIYEQQGTQGGIGHGSGQRHGGGFQGIHQNVQEMNQGNVVLGQYYGNKNIVEVIGGAISLDGRPLGYPLNRPLGPSVYNVPNIYVVDVQVHHEGPSTPQHAFVQ